MASSRFIAVLVAGIVFHGVLSVAAEQLTAPQQSPAQASVSPPGPTDPKELETFLDGVIGVEMEDLHIPGAVLVAVKDGQVMVRKGYGYANAEDRTPVRPDTTLFLIASVSKLFNATAVMQLVEQGKLKLDVDVNTYLTAFKVPDTYGQPITLTNLLTHTAGFDDRSIGMNVASKDKVLPLGVYLAMRLPRRVMPPGDFISYSNHGVALSGYVVEVVSGEPFARYVDEHIFKPLGMAHSSFDMPDAWLLDKAVGYIYKDTLRREPMGYEQVYPAGSMVSTADDIARFMIAHLEHGRYGEAQILAPQTVEEMHKIHFTHDPRLNGGIAIGFFETVRHGQTILEHGGDLPGFASHLVLFPGLRFGYFISCNADNAKLRETVSRAILDRYFPKTADETAPAPPADFNDRAAKYVGFYRFNRYARYSIEKLSSLLSQAKVSCDGTGYLILSVPGGEPRKTVEIGPDLFMNTERGTREAYRTDASGSVTQLVTVDGAFDKLPWYETAPAQCGYLALLMFVFLATAIGWPIAVVTRPWRRPTRPHSGVLASLARFAAWLVVAADAGLIIFLIYTLLNVQASEFINGVPQRMVNALYVPLVTTPGAVVIFLLCCVAWRKKWWGFFSRVHYTLVALACVGFVPFLWYWNLLGFNY